jgi:hypothetical protein
LYTPHGTQGCATSNTAFCTVIVLPLPPVSAIGSHSSICAGESATLTAIGAISYSWNPTAAGSPIVVSPGVSTTYSVTGTDNNGCSKTFAFALNVLPCTGLDSYGSNSQLLIYPNPASGSFLITAERDMQLNLVNELGQLIKTINLDENNLRSVAIDELAAGIYFVTGASNGQPVSRKIIVHN